jgi:excisionase family DNA binding protein
MPFQGTAMPPALVAQSGAKSHYRVAQVAAFFNVHRATVYREIKAGRLEAVRIGEGRGTLRVSADSLAKYKAAITAAVTASAELTVDTPLGPVDLVAVEHFRTGHQVTLTEAETALVALLAARSAGLAGVAA